MGVIAGQRYTTHQTTESRAVRDVKKEINLLEPDSYPLVAIMNKAKNRLKVTGNYEFEWFEDTLLPRFDVLAAELAANDVVMVVTNYAYFRKGDLVRVNKGEIVYVSATPTTANVAIVRAFGGAAALAANASQLHIVANVSDEGSTIGSVLSTQKVKQSNYTTLHRTPYKVSGTAQASDVYGKDDLAWEEAKAVIEHAKSIELQNILGEKKLDSVNGVRLSTSQGILSFIATNVKDAGGEFTEDEMEDFVRRCFRFGSKKKIMFVSSKLATIINGFGREKLQTTVGESTYGVTMTTYKNTGRILELVEHPLLENDALTDLTGLAGTGVVVDIGDLSFRHLKGRYMKKGRVNPNEDSTLLDGTVGEILTEGGLQLEQEKKHGEVTGATS